MLVTVVLYAFNVGLGGVLASRHGPEKSEVVSDDIAESSPLSGLVTGCGLEVYTLLLHCVPPVSEQPPVV